MRVLRAFTCLLLLSACSSRQLQRVPSTPSAVSSAAFASEMSLITGQSWLDGNDIRTLPNGGHFFPAMIKAMRSAQQTITWENFVAVESEPVAVFSATLAERAQAGVKVHVILDAYGCSTYGKEHLQRMQKAGVQVHLYSPWHLLMPLRYNHRTHRRILVVDGKTGFVGGAGLAYAWDGHAENATRWRDTMYELRGPIVSQLQDAFNDNWQQLTDKRLQGPSYFPELNAAGTHTAQSVLGAPEDMPESIGSSFCLALRAAQKSILISHAYFIPNHEIEEALLSALQRGVKVELMVPGKHTDMPLCLSVTVPLLKKLIQAGVEVREYEPCMMHGKLVVIDDYLSIIGSGNLDSRSFFINDENNVLVLSRSFALEQKAMHAVDRQRSRLLTTADLQLPISRRIKGWLGRRVKHQL